ncbi:MAG: rhodanese-like domain-containing protein [Cyclobacteriaceae bacterium]|nr:rhodanese-like domain-containing protein [Cyclobacteriaceae bacterium]
MKAQQTTRSFEDLTSGQFQQKLSENNNALLVDVRTQEEFDSVRLPEAINIDVMDRSFVEKIAVLDAGKTYFVYCRSGGRSRQACAVIASKGLHVYNLSGGIGSWKGPVVSSINA